MMPAGGACGLHEAVPYLGYSYAYPHKRAYRPLAPPVPLAEAWSQERKDALFLYLHIPFCEARCGYCNLFTLPNADLDLVDAYLQMLERQAMQVKAALGDASFARLALGGGTPTLLPAASLARLFDLARRVFGADAHVIPCSVETSPRTAEEDRLRVLRDYGLTRVSIGVQSFVEEETARAGRAQARECVEGALGRIRSLGFPVLNVDLIYGLPGQSVESWLSSLRAALRWRPEEFYLYPLYTRPLTGLGQAGWSWPDTRIECYRAGRDLLLAEGYAQLSMRAFRAHDAPGAEGPVYCCQEDGMVGLGCGARSYTRSLHYASEHALAPARVREILRGYVARTDEELAVADHGVRLDEEEQRRRWVIKSLLRAEGFLWRAYRARFDSEALTDLPDLQVLLDLELAADQGDGLRLTEAGLERSDAIGPFLQSARMRRLAEEGPIR